MAVVFDVFTGQLSIIPPASLVPGGTPVPGATPYSILTVDGSNILSTVGPLLNGQLIIGSTGGAAVAATLTGTSNQVSIANASGSITISLPQDIATSSSPTFSAIRYKDSGSNYVQLASPAVLGANVSFVLPNADGLNGQVLQTDGAGNLSWINNGSITVGTLDSQPKVADAGVISGSSLYLQSADASYPGVVTIAAQTFAGVKTFNSVIYSDGGLDISAAGTLSIGSVNASIINIGNASATINFNGTVNNKNVINLNVTDQLITINHGGGAGSASGAGIEIEEAASITGYIKTSGDRNSYLFKAPNTAGIVTLTPGALGFTIDQGSHDPVTVTDSNSIDLTLATQDIQADLRISSNAADVGYLVVNNNIESTGAVGLRSQISISSITSALDSTYVNVSGDTMTGTLTLSDASVPLALNSAAITASRPLKVDASKNVVSALIDLSSTNDITGTLAVGHGGTGSTSFTAGSVVFSNGSALIEDNTNLYFDDTNNYLKVKNQIQIGSVDPFSRTQIWNYGPNAVLRLGSLTSDGDPTDVSSEGIVSYGQNLAAEPMSSIDFGYARVKHDRFGLYTSNDTGYVGYYFRVDPTSLYFTDDAGVKTFEVTRTTGQIDTNLGAGIVHSNASGILSSSAVSLTADVSGILPLANGGTNTALTASAGSVAYSDASGLQLSAVGSSGQFLQSNGASAPSFADFPASNIIYVDKTGNDATGNGSLNRPYLTVAAAMAAVSSPTSTNIFCIKVGVGTFTEATLTLKPWTWIVGTGGMTMGGPSRISVTSTAITLDASWAAGSQRGGLSQIYLTGSTGVTFDRQSISGVGSGVLEMFDVGMNGALTFKGTSLIDYLDVKSIRVFGNVSVSGGSIQFFDSELLGNVTFNDTGSVDVTSDVLNTFIAGNFTAASTTNSVAVRLSDVRIDGTRSITGTGTSVTSPLGAYRPSTPANWSSVPVSIEQGLDNLAATIAGSSAITALTGDVTATGPGSVAATIASHAVSNSKFRQSSALSVVGNSTNATADVADISASVDGQVLRRSGTSLDFGLLVDANISASAAIARSKIAAGTPNHVLINDGSGNLSSESILNVSRGGTGVDGSTAANGAILIGNSTGYTLATISAGTGISITNGAGSISVASTITQYTDEMAQDAVGNILINSSTITFTYNDALNQITADVTALSITNSHVSATAAIARSKIASGSANHVVINDGSGNLSSEANLAVSRGGTGSSLSGLTAEDVILGSSSTALKRLGVGSNGQVLTVSGGAVAWATPASDSPTVFGSRGTPRNIVAGTGITSGAGHMSTTATQQTIFIQGSGGAVTVTANPRIEAHTVVGATMTLIGRDNTNTVTLGNGNGLELNGDVTLGASDTLTLMWDGSVYVEIARS